MIEWTRIERFNDHAMTTSRSLKGWEFEKVLHVFTSIGRGLRRHTYVIKSSFVEWTRNATNFCSFEWGPKQRRTCSSRTKEIAISNPIQSLMLLINFTIFLSMEKKKLNFSCKVSLLCSEPQNEMLNGRWRRNRIWNSDRDRVVSDSSQRNKNLLSFLLFFSNAGGCFFKSHSNEQKFFTFFIVLVTQYYGQDFPQHEKFV